MAVSYDYILAGQVTDSEQVLNKLKRKVGQFATRTQKYFFIGKASGGNTPDTRWQRKYANYHDWHLDKYNSMPSWGSFERMIVLCETETVQQALGLERGLVDYYRNKRDGKRNIANPIAGGGGARGANPGYVYLVLSYAATEDLLSSPEYLEPECGNDFCCVM